MSNYGLPVWDNPPPPPEKKMPDYTQGGIVKGPTKEIRGDVGAEIVIPRHMLNSSGLLVKVKRREKDSAELHSPRGFSIESTSEIIEENGQTQTTAPRYVIKVEAEADKTEVIAMLKSIWNV